MELLFLQIEYLGYTNRRLIGFFFLQYKDVISPQQINDAMKSVFKHKYQILLTSLIFCWSSSFLAQVNLNVEVYVNHLLNDERYSGSWYYVDEVDNEYALLGAKGGTSVIAIQGQNDSEEKAYIPGPSSNWREITVLGDYAYVVTEGGADTVGMHVIDLSPLPDQAPYLLTEYKATFGRGHIIQRDIYVEDPYVYIIGTQSTGGVHILDVSDPNAPTEVGLYDPDYYIHDAHVNGDLMFCAAFNIGQMDIVDISDKTNPILINSFEDPALNTHSCWLTEDKNFLFMASEKDSLVGRIFNIEDIDDIYEVSQYTANLASLVHNPYIRGDYAFISHNTEGLRVVDVLDPVLPVEVGFYDTFDGPSGGFFGLWSACPYLPSGKIIGGDRTRGLFVWEFNNTKAGRIYGKVVDESSGEPLPGALIAIPELDTVLIADANGEYKIGFYPTNVNLNVSFPLYQSESEEYDLSEGGSITTTTALQLINNTNEIFTNSITSIFPSPAKDYIQVELMNQNIGKRTFVIRNVAGEIVRSIEIEYANSFKLDIANLTSGVYFISGDGSEKPVSFVKM